MSAGDCRQIVERFMDRFLAGREFAAVDEMCAADVTYQMPVGIAYGQSGLKTTFEKTFQAFPDCQFKPDFSVAAEDHVTVRMTMRATFAGFFADIEPNGRKMVLPQVWTFRIADECIADIQVYFDTRIVMETLGVPPARTLEHG